MSIVRAFPSPRKYLGLVLCSSSIHKSQAGDLTLDMYMRNEADPNSVRGKDREWERRRLAEMRCGWSKAAYPQKRQGYTSTKTLILMGRQNWRDSTGEHCTGRESQRERRFRKARKHTRGKEFLETSAGERKRRSLKGVRVLGD